MNGSRRHSALCGLFAAVAMGAGIPSAWSQVPLAASYFDEGIEGWMASGDPAHWTAEYLVAGGNPGGCIQATDVPVGTWVWLHAPAKFLGDQSRACGHRFTFDLRAVNAPPDSAGNADVQLLGETIALACSAGPEPEAGWTRYTLYLDSRTPWHLNSMSGPLASDAEICEVLSSLNLLRIRAEFDGSPDQTQLDNVVLEGDAACNLLADLDGDLDVDLFDLALLLVEFGAFCLGG